MFEVFNTYFIFSIAKNERKTALNVHNAMNGGGGRGVEYPKSTQWVRVLAAESDFVPLPPESTSDAQTRWEQKLPSIPLRNTWCMLKNIFSFSLAGCKWIKKECIWPQMTLLY